MVLVILGVWRRSYGKFVKKTSQHLWRKNICNAGPLIPMIILTIYNPHLQSIYSQFLRSSLSYSRKTPIIPFVLAPFRPSLVGRGKMPNITANPAIPSIPPPFPKNEKRREKRQKSKKGYSQLSRAPSRWPIPSVHARRQYIQNPLRL